MAQKQLVVLEDDLEGGEATATLQFGFDGVDYEIDLNDKNAAKLRETFGVYVGHARKVANGGRRRRASARRPSAPVGVDNQAVRAWARANGVELSSRGRIPTSVIERYRAAGN